MGVVRVNLVHPVDLVKATTKHILGDATDKTHEYQNAYCDLK